MAASYNRRMRILAIDVGTGTQDILLFDSSQPIENAFQLIMPSPTHDRGGAHPAGDGGEAAVARERHDRGRRAVPLGAGGPPARGPAGLRDARGGDDVRR